MPRGKKRGGRGRKRQTRQGVFHQIGRGRKTPVQGGEEKGWGEEDLMYGQ